MLREAKGAITIADILDVHVKLIRIPHFTKILQNVTLTDEETL
jgi:hypothetical protein